jgi:hypothetical protein
MHIYETCAFIYEACHKRIMDYLLQSELDRINRAKSIALGVLIPPDWKKWNKTERCLKAIEFKIMTDFEFRRSFIGCMIENETFFYGSFLEDKIVKEIFIIKEHVHETRSGQKIPLPRVEKRFTNWVEDKNF